MRVAFASESGTHIDQHYGKARSFYVWEIGPNDAACVGRIVPPTVDEDSRMEASLAARADALADCAILFTTQIGGPAAAKLVGRHVHPMKASGVTPIPEMVTRLQGVLRSSPPPWLRKLMNGDERPACRLEVGA